MKHLVKIFALGAALAASSSLAHADSIQFTGVTSFNTTSGAVTFDNSQTKVAVAGNNSLSEFTLASTATFSAFNYKTPIVLPVGTLLLSVSAPDGAKLNFFMTSDTATANTNAAGITLYDFTGTGYYALTNASGATTILGGFDLGTSSNSGTSNLAFQDFQFTTAAAATPEPSSLIMLGTGLVSAAGMLVRRRRVV